MTLHEQELSRQIEILTRQNAELRERIVDLVKRDEAPSLRRIIYQLLGIEPFKGAI